MERYLVVCVLLVVLPPSLQEATNKTDNWEKERTFMVTGLRTLQKRLKIFKAGIEFEAFAEAQLAMTTEITMKTDPMLAIVSIDEEEPKEIKTRLKKCYRTVKRNLTELADFVYNYHMANCSNAFVNNMDELLREINDVYFETENVIKKLREIESECATRPEDTSLEDCAKKHLESIRESLNYMAFLYESKRRDVREATKDALAQAELCFADKRITEILVAAQPFISAAAANCVQAAHNLPSQ